jgi:uncharacterized BrkB/YihY/UPF0761 family membrane protein
MFRKRRIQLAGLMLGLIIPLLMGMATPVFARSISLKDAGTTLWIFIFIGAAIVLLQLIPAAILFFSFVGTSSSMVFRRKREAGKVAGEEKAGFPGIEPAPAKK